MPKVSSCCGAEYEVGKFSGAFYCGECCRVCQLVDKPVESEHWIDRALYSSQLHIPKPVAEPNGYDLDGNPIIYSFGGGSELEADPVCQNCNGTGKVDIYNANAELKDITCHACQPVEPELVVVTPFFNLPGPVAQSSPNLDELMPLEDFIDDEVIAKCWLAPLYEGAKKQLAADKAVTARLLAEKDTRIVGLESRIEGYRQYIKELVAEKDQAIKRVQGDYDLLAEEHRVYRDKIKELEAKLAKLKAPFRDEVSGAWIDPCPKT